METYGIRLTTATGGELAIAYTEAWWARKYAGIDSIKGFDEYTGVTYETDVTVAGTTELKATPYAASRELEIKFFKTDCTAAELRAFRDNIDAFMMTYNSVNVTRTFYNENGKGVAARRYTGLITGISEWERTDETAYLTVTILALNPRSTSVTPTDLPDPGTTPPPDWTDVNALVDADVAATYSNLVTWMGDGVDKDLAVTPTLLAPYKRQSSDNVITILVADEVITVRGNNPRSGYSAVPVTLSIVRLDPQQAIRDKLDSYVAQTKKNIEDYWAANPTVDAYDIPFETLTVEDRDNGYYLFPGSGSIMAAVVSGDYIPPTGNFRYRSEMFVIFQPEYDYEAYTAAKNNVKQQLETIVANWQAANPDKVRTADDVAAFANQIVVPAGNYAVNFVNIANVNEIYFGFALVVNNGNDNFQEIARVKMLTPEYYGRKWAESCKAVAINLIDWVRNYYQNHPTATADDMGMESYALSPITAEWFPNISWNLGTAYDPNDDKAFIVQISTYNGENAGAYYRSTDNAAGIELEGEWNVITG